MNARASVVVLILIATYACEPLPSNYINDMSFSDPEEQALFRQGLTDAGIAFTVGNKDGREYLHWDPRDAARAMEVKVNIFGPDLPSGRNISFEGEMQDRFKAWLEQRQIPYKVVEKRGVEYVVWDQAVDERVKEWPYLPHERAQP